MSQPDPLGAIGQLLMGTNHNPADKLGWHTFRVMSPRGGEAGRWCNNMIQGEWTFKADFGSVFFYIKGDRDAMAFKLAWSSHIK